jgi:tetratricopeptide (TPR) repeat protein
MPFQLPKRLIAVWLIASAAQAADGTQSAIRFLEDKVKDDPDDFIAWNQLAARYHQQLRKTGDDRFLGLEQRAAEQSLAAIPADQNPGGLAALAQARLAAHRFAEARDAAIELCELTPDKPHPLELLADASIELGDYDEARKACAELAKMEDADLSALPRLARLETVAGHVDRARKNLTRGLALGSQFTSEDPDLVAWFHVQLGELAFKSGDWKTAEKHYTAAAEAWPASYSAADHLAELRAAQGDTAEAITLYEKLSKRVPRPEFFQALGDLQLLAKQPDQADKWFARAEEAYLRSTKEGAVHYFHHLAGFYADSKEDPAKAVEWARKDLELRHSIQAYDALGWALYKNGQAAEAAEWVAKALATGTRDPHLLYHAGLVRMAAGDIAGGKAALQQASAANPKFNTFHMHR